MPAKRKNFYPFKKQQRKVQKIKREVKKETAVEAELTEVVLREEKVLSSSFRGLAGKEAREVRVTEALSFMPSALLALINTFDEAFDKETFQLLTYVVQGEQEQAETLLKSNPGLLFEKGTVTDLSKRTFKDITAFQYALWALDWHMWKMLLKYMPLEAAAMQFEELEDKGTAHGKHFSLMPLIEALDAYVKKYDAWCKASNFAAMNLHWCKQVGGAQLLLPMHVINEYCRSDRSFSPQPSFTEERLLRMQNFYYGDKREWFTSIVCDGALGVKFAAHRSSLPGAGGSGTMRVVGAAACDRDAMQSLLKTRQEQLLSLEDELVAKKLLVLDRVNAGHISRWS